jgi:hypothetical protein
MKGTCVEITRDVYELALKAWKESNNLEMKKRYIAALEKN